MFGSAMSGRQSYPLPEQHRVCRWLRILDQGKKLSSMDRYRLLTRGAFMLYFDWCFLYIHTLGNATRSYNSSLPTYAPLISFGYGALRCN